MTPPVLTALDARQLTRIVVIGAAETSCFEAAARFAPAGVDFQRADAGLHPALTYDEAEATAAMGRPMLPGERGAYSSHYALWEELESGNVDQCVVLSEDLIVDWGFIGKLAGVDMARMGIDYLRLNHRYPMRTRTVKASFIDRDRFIIELDGPAAGATAYALTRAGARFFLDRCRAMARPIAEEMGRAWSRTGRNLTLFPSPVMERSEQLALCEDRESLIRRTS